MLKECPFCGGIAKYELLYGGYQQIICTTCGASSTLIQATLEKSKKEVFEELKLLWNKRIKDIEVNNEVSEKINENFDMNALYLYTNRYSYKIGKIKKINSKSIIMDDYTKIKFKDFKDVHKLTDEEIKNYNQELIKELGNSAEYGKISNMKRTLANLLNTLKESEFVCIDSEKLEKELNTLSDLISKYIPKLIEIDENLYSINQNGDILKESEA